MNDSAVVLPADRRNHFDWLPRAPHALYDPADERDACGVCLIANIDGRPSREILDDANTSVRSMEHRGACGIDERSGDGAGVMTGIPDALFRATCSFSLPPAGHYGTGVIFTSPANTDAQARANVAVAEAASEAGLQVLGYRDVPRNSGILGVATSASEPRMQTIFVAAAQSNDPTSRDITSRLFLMRKRLDSRLAYEKDEFYLCSLSSTTYVLKGMLTPCQLWDYFCDLRDARYISHFAIVHTRFSTNTLPSWPRAHPNRVLAHNGEINTLLGNVNRMSSRQPSLKSTVYSEDELKSMMPVVDPHASDSGQLDNTVDFLVANGRSLAEAMSVCVPQPWENAAAMGIPSDVANFYEFHSFVMEPWDGPGLFVFSDGKVAGAVLDRNGLRPARYAVTKTGRLYMASEAGTVPLQPESVTYRGRLRAGHILLVDFSKGVIVPDHELKREMATAAPYGQWIRESVIPLEGLTKSDLDERSLVKHLPRSFDPRLPASGMTLEHLYRLMVPMVLNGKEELGSMGNDAPLGVLSPTPRSLYDYFKQVFAQVTNPPIDPFREANVMSLKVAVGPVGNVFAKEASIADVLTAEIPIISLQDMATIRDLPHHKPEWVVVNVDATWPREGGPGALRSNVDRICSEAEAACDRGARIVILSDRALSAERVLIPTLLAVGAVHQHLIKTQKRLQVGLVVESADAREVHHMCLLMGFGADLVCPWLLIESMLRYSASGIITQRPDLRTITTRLQSAYKTGMMKVMAKMGIATMNSYRYAQVFEAIGLDPDIVDYAFCGTRSRIKGLDFRTFALEVLAMHQRGFPTRVSAKVVPRPIMPDLGEYHWREGGEHHINAPAAIAALQAAVRTADNAQWRRFTDATDREVDVVAVRGRLEFRFGALPAVDLSDVEPASEILKRFATGAMSYGSISLEAHTALARAMNKIGGKSNTGEGGEDPRRFVKDPLTGESERSAIKQVASGRFGVTAYYLTNADELQIKMAQGAKPGEGGELPGHKVNAEIAAVRHSTPGVGLISPPPHHDIYSIEDLAQLIHDLKSSNPSARVSVKLVAKGGVGVIAAGVAKGKAETILISGHDGGTGASSWTGIKHAGLPWEFGVAETQQALVRSGLRGRVVLQTDGQLRTARDVCIAAALGAEEFGFATVPLIALGCTMMRKCHLNTCPVGIATQDPELRAKFAGRPEHVVRYFMNLAEDVRAMLARLGLRKLDQLVGRVDLLRQRKPSDADSPKVRNLDLACLLEPSVALNPSCPQHHVAGFEADHGLQSHLDVAIIRDVIAMVKKVVPGAAARIDACTTTNDLTALETLRGTAKDGFEEAIGLLEEYVRKSGEGVQLRYTVTNVNRDVATTLSHRIAKLTGPNGLPPRSITITLVGAAGQSCGAFMTRGVTVRVIGETNDGFGKGLSGGVLVIRPHDDTDAEAVSLPVANSATLSLAEGKSGVAAPSGVPTKRVRAVSIPSDADILGGRSPSSQVIATDGSIVVGNVAFYGATSGRAFIRGGAAERFCVRNSGVVCVVEAVGDHGCEYMTGGRVVVLGPTGQNFGSGMTGGIAFVYDPENRFPDNCNHKTVELSNVQTGALSSDALFLQDCVVEHYKHTGSPFARSLIESWGPEVVGAFVKVLPTDYRRALEEKQKPTLPPRMAVLGGRESHWDNQLGLGDIEDIGGHKSRKIDKVTGFKSIPRRKDPERDPMDRMDDFQELSQRHDKLAIRQQAARCMDCGIPFCQQTETGCPLGNVIPRWNDLVFHGRYQDALWRLLLTNNFPEFTGRVCPAPCEGACVLGINAEPVAIKSMECFIIDTAFAMGWVAPRPPPVRSGRTVAVIGSGPAGLACADTLNKAGHTVTIFEKESRCGGLLMYGIPNMKLDKAIVNRRLRLMRAEGVKFVTNTALVAGDGDTPPSVLDDTYAHQDDEFGDLPTDAIPLQTKTLVDLRRSFDAVCICVGAGMPRGLPIPGSDLRGIHFAMEFLGRFSPRIEPNVSVNGKDVVIIGGGDTGNDCLGTSLREHAKSVTMFEILPRPPPDRANDNPWPQWPRIMRVDYGHKEAIARDGLEPRRFNVLSKRFIGDASGSVIGVLTIEVEWFKIRGQWAMREVPGTERVFPCQAVFLALGFVGMDMPGSASAGLPISKGNTIITQPGRYDAVLTGEEPCVATSPKTTAKSDDASPSERGDSLGKSKLAPVFTAGDCRRGQSLIVWAISEGRQAARQIDSMFMGSTTIGMQGGLRDVPVQDVFQLQVLGETGAVRL
eukprot:TRINITY_DN330_c0_g1_i1.p1 TRINITY_DN330_c0_g1~~TRINITY_DN330_c0_g1_i1.p1  ORF type:complete len:2246 (+),score=201.61 TRINITY_DN330_c0_g1_i1:142-6879(+)